MKIVIVLVGGVVQHVVASEACEVTVIDYDTEGADEGSTVDVPQDGGGTAEAYVTDPAIYVNPARAAELTALLTYD